jgi:hypothetical protein
VESRPRDWRRNWKRRTGDLEVASIGRRRKEKDEEHERTPGTDSEN